MKSTYILIPCYNRRSITLQCLQRLQTLGLLEFSQVVVIDDASTDGSLEAIRECFPEVNVISGNGELYWTGAIEAGMRWSHERGAEAIVWLNDDTVVEQGAIEAIVARSKETRGVVSGQGVVNIESKNYEWFFPLTYRTKTGLINKEVDRAIQEHDVDTCRGNLVAIHRQVVDKIGFPDGTRIPHFSGDTDYGLRASRAGISVKVLPHALVRETEIIRSDNQSWLLSETPVWMLWRRLFQKRNAFYPPMLFCFYYRHWGWIGFLKASFKMMKLMGISVLKLVVPRKMRISLFGGHSHSWKTLAPLRASNDNTGR